MITVALLYYPGLLCRDLN